MKKTMILLALFSARAGSAQISYEDSLIAERKNKEIELLDASKGILNQKDLEHFSGLYYFYVDTTLILNAVIERSKGKRFEMPTSTERTPIYRRMGYLHFSIHGQAHRLTIYQNMELKSQKKYKNYYFIPFRDATSGEMTYGGGRYMDLTILKNQTAVQVDFNQAYNPYCVYSHRYSCPIPPDENTLKIGIFAGEKIPIYHEDK